MTELNERRAKFVYEATRIAAIAAEAPIVPEPWIEREGDFVTQFLEVIERQCGRYWSDDAEQLHQDWVEAYEKNGWHYGPVRDVEKRTHPDMVPFHELGQLEQDKDYVFVILCEIARRYIRGTDAG